MAELIKTTGIPHWLQPPKLARGDHYSEWTWEEVLSRLRSGHTLTSICKDETMPQYEQLLRWIHGDAHRKAHYYEARAIGAEGIEDQLLAIADGVDNEMEDVTRSTLRIQTRKWLLGVWDRKRYAETKQIDINSTIDLSDAMATAMARVEGRQAVLIEGEVTDGD